MKVLYQIKVGIVIEGKDLHDCIDIKEKFLNDIKALTTEGVIETTTEVEDAEILTTHSRFERAKWLDKAEEKE